MLHFARFQSPLWPKNTINLNVLISQTCISVTVLYHCPHLYFFLQANLFSCKVKLFPLNILKHLNCPDMYGMHISQGTARICIMIVLFLEQWWDIFHLSCIDFFVTKHWLSCRLMLHILAARQASLLSVKYTNA